MRRNGGESRIRVHRFLPVSEAEGPGQRAALWVQGCPIRCPGCFNRQTWSLHAGQWRTVDDLFRQIAARPGLEGVTFSGGEPFAQAGPLARLGHLCRDAGLSVMTFTGYEFSYIRQHGEPDWQDLLAVTDLLLAGPFLKSREDYSRPWVGSSNQQFVFLTARYRFLEPELQSIPDRVEVWLDDCSISLNGTVPGSVVVSIRKDLASLGLRLTTERRTL